MGRRYRFIAGGLLYIVLIVGAVGFLSHGHIAVLNPAGTLAARERHLIYITLLLSLIVVVPVFALLFGIAWRYRESNPDARYEPNWDHSRVMEAIWWLVPLALITVLAGITWRSTHELDPTRALADNNHTMTIQVVSLDWKWLFIYPDSRIATVNYVEIPTDQPVRFVLTSDAPMNSFWVPQLSGQIYTMPGMSTQLNVEATKSGDFTGSSANISGIGFSGMHFMVKARDTNAYNTWLGTSLTTAKTMSMDDYTALAKPSQNVPQSTYRMVPNELFDTIMAKYMAPTMTMPTGTDDMKTMDMGTMNMTGVSL